MIIKGDYERFQRIQTLREMIVKSVLPINILQELILNGDIKDVYQIPPGTLMRAMFLCCDMGSSSLQRVETLPLMKIDNIIIYVGKCDKCGKIIAAVQYEEHEESDSE